MFSAFESGSVTSWVLVMFGDKLGLLGVCNRAGRQPSVDRRLDRIDFTCRQEMKERPSALRDVLDVLASYNERFYGPELEG